jgi:capsular exopolysaccharide synthesis family protein
MDRFDLEKYDPRDEHSLDRPDPRNSDRYGYNVTVPLTDTNAILREYWRRIYKHRWLILALAFLVSSLVAIEVFRTKSIYEASATIEVGSDNRTLFRAGDVSIDTEDNDYFSVKMAMQGKLRVLASRPLLEVVALRLKLDQNPAFFDVTQRKSILESARTIWARLRHPGSSGGQARAASTRQDPIEDTSALTPEDHQRLAPVVGVLAANVAAQPVEYSRMLTVSYRHSDPSLAAEIVNTIADVFIDQSYKNKTRRLHSTSDWLSARTREFKSKVEQAEQELNKYTASHNIFSTEGKENLTIDKLSALHSQVTKAETDRILRESLYNEVKAGNVGQLPDAYTDPKIGALQTRLGDLAVKEAEYSRKYGPSNPNVQDIQKQKAALEKQVNESRATLEKRLKADYDRSVRDETSLKAALEKAKHEAIDQNQSNIQYAILSQNVDTAKKLYTDFLQKTNQVDIQVAEQGNNMQLIEPAVVPGAPVGPQRLRTILIAFLLSLAGGIVIALGLEYLNNTIKTVDDVSRYVGLPTLAIIPVATSRLVKGDRSSGSLGGKLAGKITGGLTLKANGRSEANGAAIPPLRKGMTNLLTANSHSAFAEAYRGLRTSVLLSSAGGPPKTILITSSQPAEGKTTTAINTGISLGHLGVSVLIIDADMRKPSAHRAFGVDNQRGLSTYLSRDVELGELIQKLPVENLSLLPSGAVPPNPAELVSSAKMKDMLRLLADQYDHILIDSPPMINVTDPLILSTLVDGVLLVVEGGKTTRNVVRRARIELANVGARIFGVILNNVNLKREGYDDYYYHRYNSYYYGSKSSTEQADTHQR